MEILKEYVDLSIFAVLGLMAVIAMYLCIERILFFWSVKFEDYKNSDDLEDCLLKNMTGLYIIYSNAPYVGLLGTVVGIMVVFYDMGVSGGMDTKSIMVGLSLALKATALGLLIAIPTLIIYNLFARKIERILYAYKRYCGGSGEKD